MPKYYVTFGLGYDIEKHPHVPGINPDSYVEVEAISELDARSEVFNIFGDKWAFLYHEKNFDKSFFPKGKFATLEEIKDWKLDTFHYLQKGANTNNPVSITSEKEMENTLNKEQLMIMNNVVSLFSTMATFPRVDKYHNYIKEFEENIKKGLSEKDGSISKHNEEFCQYLIDKIKELIKTIKD